MVRLSDCHAICARSQSRHRAISQKMTDRSQPALRKISRSFLALPILSKRFCPLLPTLNYTCSAGRRGANTAPNTAHAFGADFNVEIRNKSALGFSAAENPVSIICEHAVNVTSVILDFEFIGCSSVCSLLYSCPYLKGNLYPEVAHLYSK